MVTEIKKHRLYKWLAPQYAAGLIFRVIRITPKSYFIRYINSVHKDFVPDLEISNSFIVFNLFNLKQVG